MTTSGPNFGRTLLWDSTETQWFVWCAIDIEYLYGRGVALTPILGGRFLKLLAYPNILRYCYRTLHFWERRLRILKKMFPRQTTQRSEEHVDINTHASLHHHLLCQMVPRLANQESGPPRLRISASPFQHVLGRMFPRSLIGFSGDLLKRPLKRHTMTYQFSHTTWRLEKTKRMCWSRYFHTRSCLSRDEFPQTVSISKVPEVLFPSERLTQLVILITHAKNLLASIRQCRWQAKKILLCVCNLTNFRTPQHDRRIKATKTRRVFKTKKKMVNTWIWSHQFIIIKGSGLVVHASLHRDGAGLLAMRHEPRDMNDG